MQLDEDLVAIQEVRNKLKLANKAQELLGKLDQPLIDQIIENMSKEAVKAASRLAQLAVEETGFGIVEDKITKNLFAAKEIYGAIKEMKTVGIIKEDPEKNLWEIAEPVGVIAGIVPTTNPTSTIIFKSLIALKARNAIVFSPHPSALQCSLLTAEIMNDAAKAAGAPDNVIQCLERPSLLASKELMSHKITKIILATGGPGMVKAAYSSGKPAYGVGPGNVPVYVHSSADIAKAARQIIQSKSFDNGTICASEQAIVTDENIKSQLINELRKHGAYFLNAEEKGKVASIIQKGNGLNPAIVGQSPQKLAEMTGIKVSDSIKVLVGEEETVSKETPFAIEKLSPILAFYTVLDWQQGCQTCMDLLEIGGMGHTLGIHANDQEVIKEFALKKPASRIIVNSGTTFGGIGATTGIFPSMTLGCGTYGNNITSDNINPMHLLNIKRVAFGIKEMKEEERKEPIAQLEEVHFSEEEIARIVREIINQLN